MYRIYKKIFAFFFISLTWNLGWGSSQTVKESNDDSCTQYVWKRNDSSKNRGYFDFQDLHKKCFHVFLSSSTIPLGKDPIKSASAELDRLTILASQKGYNLTQHVLFARKERTDIDSIKYFLVGFPDYGRTSMLVTYFCTKIFLEQPPYISKPFVAMNKASLDFFIYRPAQSTAKL